MNIFPQEIVFFAGSQMGHIFKTIEMTRDEVAALFGADTIKDDSALLTLKVPSVFDGNLATVANQSDFLFSLVIANHKFRFLACDGLGVFLRSLIFVVRRTEIGKVGGSGLTQSALASLRLGLRCRMSLVTQTVRMSSSRT